MGDRRTRKHRIQVANKERAVSSLVQYARLSAAPPASVIVMAHSLIGYMYCQRLMPLKEAQASWTSRARYQGSSGFAHAYWYQPYLEMTCRAEAYRRKSTRFLKQDTTIKLRTLNQPPLWPQREGPLHAAAWLNMAIDHGNWNVMRLVGWRNSPVSSPCWL